MLREPQRHDAHVQDAGARVRPGERVLEHRAVVFTWHEDYLRVHLDAGGQQAVERGQPVRGVPAHEPAAHAGVGRVKRHAQGRDALFQDARLVLGCQVREGDEGAGQKAQPEVVVAQRERGAHAFGQLAHEAEQARVPALLDAVEHHAFEGEAPVLPFVAHKLHLARVAVQIDVADARDVVG